MRSEAIKELGIQDINELAKLCKHCQHKHL
ncbi:MAG: hypothetical protein ACI9J2_001601 [Saprospiraceae bacterium]|jgi:hypothetical protein